MKKLTLFFTFLIPLVAFSTTYTTLNSGDWDNTTNVWSTDGVNPCLCAPSSILTNDTVEVKHAINLNVDLTLKVAAIISVYQNGSLIGAGSVIETGNNSKLHAAGPVLIKKLVINSNSSVSVYWATLDIQTRLEIYGTLEIESSNLSVVQGNVMVYEGALFDLTGGSYLHFDEGNFNNFGTTNLCAECCIQIDAGNIKNEASGVLNGGLGGGSMVSSNGNVQNEGYWDTEIQWCSAGFDFGLPIPENCLLTSTNCGAFPLPVEIISFTGEAQDGYNDIKWVTATELNCDYYVLERSLDGKDWTSLVRVDGQGTSINESKYSIQDFIKSDNTYYYRLVQFDFNMNQNKLGVISVKSFHVSKVRIYPNPTSGRFTIGLEDEDQDANIYMYDMGGNEVLNIPNVKSESIELEPQVKSGLYIIGVEIDGKVETFKLIIR